MASDDELTPTGAIDASVACPYLGLVDDADSHATFATDAHRCYRLTSPTRIAAGHQDSFCLSDNHVSCPVYLGEAVTQARQGGGRPAVGKGQRPRPAAAGRQRSGRDEGLSPRPRPGGIPVPALTIGALVLAAILLGLAIWVQGLGGDDDDGLSPSDTLQTQTALKTQQARTPQPSPSAATQVSGTQTQTQAVGSPTGTRPPGTATTAGGRTYTVVSGDNCSTIAEKNNITLEQLFQANNLDNEKCTQLQVGQVLKIP